MEFFKKIFKRKVKCEPTNSSQSTDLKVDETPEKNSPKQTTNK